MDLSIDIPITNYTLRNLERNEKRGWEGREIQATIRKRIRVTRNWTHESLMLLKLLALKRK